jgi:hypothetical protein
MKGTKSAFFTTQNTSLCCLQQTVHFMLALNIFISLPPPDFDKKEAAQFNYRSHMQYQTAHCCWCADELFICRGDLFCVVCAGFVVFCL